MMMNEYRFDRNAFEILSFKEADKRMNDHREMSWQERLRLANYLISISYGFTNDKEPRMDKTIFSMRKTTNA